MNWILRVRNTATDRNGTPNLVAGGVSTNLTHVVATHTTASRTLYVDGVRRARDALGGSLETWIDQPLLVANEGVDDGARFWRGSIYRIVIYSRAMAATEVTARFNAGL